MRAVLGVVESEGIHQPVSWGWPVLSTPKRTAVKGSLSEAGVVATVCEGCRTSCHWLRAKRMQTVA